MPVAVLTSSDEEEDIVRSYRLGASSCIRKSIDFEPFLRPVREVSVRSLLLDEPPGDAQQAAD